jgi:DNA-binding NarL/FixJ family response regulator
VAKRHRRERRDLVLVIASDDWPQELDYTVSREGHNVIRIGTLAAAPQALLAGMAGGVCAIIVHERLFSSGDGAALKRCRSMSPSAALIVLTLAPDQPPPRDAFDKTVTAFLTWPAPVEEVRAALGSARRGTPAAFDACHHG